MPGNNGAPGHCQGETCGHGKDSQRPRGQEKETEIRGHGEGPRVRGLKEGSEVKGQEKGSGVSGDEVRGQKLERSVEVSGRQGSM